MPAAVTCGSLSIQRTARKFSSGSVAGTLLVGGIHKFRRLGLLMLGGAAGSAVSLMGFALAVEAGLFNLTLVLVFVTATFASVFMIASMTVMLWPSPEGAELE